MQLKKLRCHENSFNLAISLFFALVLNGLFLFRAWERIPYTSLHDYFFAASLPLVLTAAFGLIFNLVAWPYLRKPLLAVLILTSAAANYVMFSFGTVIDTNMVQNVFETDLQESTALLSRNAVIWLLLMGVAPTIIILLTRFKRRECWWMNLAWRALFMAASLGIILLMALLFYKDYASLIRNNKGLVKMITPANIVSGAGHYVNNRWMRGSQAWVHIGQDAHKGPIIAAEQKKTLVVLVVGETARAENFSLGGYARETNPQLKKQNVIYYPHHQDGVLDILGHAGVSVLWRENDGGCKGACDRVPHTDMTLWKLNAWCQEGSCLDDVLLHRLGNYTHSLNNDGIIVLHQMGSHGPAYYRRYPPQFRQFTPTCDSNQIQDCDHQALMNTYDNTLLYSDDMIARTIDMLKGLSDRFNVALVYLSDHGESLGEHGMYLHGAPYLFAPSQQTHIPLLLWMSDDYAKTYGISQACLRQQAPTAEVSQDNLFHTLLGMFNVQTSEYQPQLDMIRTCRKAG
ncbi:sulfatase-like hydrolase/transferase [Pantoea septica]|uniref:sulfatase-like hydrolase/transferase n=1 Tax=Pantoea septica TaxID=472695 RepID=UPI0028AD7EBC|nr:sulfatase-like hydrolase/transferase [Pantoea septica]